MHIVSGFLRAAVREVFSTMLGIEVKCDENQDDTAEPPVLISGVSGSISLTGKMIGTVFLNFSVPMANAAAGKILGDDNPAASDVNDVVGELTNMITGNLKSKMADKGFNCALSIPTILRGQDVSVNAKDAQISLRNVFTVPAICGGAEFSVECFAKLEGPLS